MNAENIAANLGRYTPKSGGGFMACCPAHEDTNPSLAISDYDGRLLVKCFAGCGQDNVIEALKKRGLWPTNGMNKTLSPERRRGTRKLWAPILPIPEGTPSEPMEHPIYGKPNMSWRYVSIDGGLLQIINRFDTNDGKQVLPLTFCTDGKRNDWRWQALSDSRPLYGLNLIGGASYVVVVEGEKTADAARRLLGDRLPVVTWSGGSNAVVKTDWSPLAGIKVTIWPDADGPGAKAALTVSNCLVKIGAKVKIVIPPTDVSQGWDLADAETEGWTSRQVKDALKRAINPEEFAPDRTLATLATLAEDIEPLPLRRTLPKADNFPLEALPQVLRDMVEEITRIIQPPAALASQSVLAAASLAVQALADVSIDGRRSPLSCFFISVGDSGERKSTVDNAVLAPHRKHERTLTEIAKNNFIDYQASLEAWKKEREKASKDKSNIKQAILDLGAEPEAPLSAQMITEEPTYEGIFKLLQSGLPSIGIFAAEGGRFIGGHAMGKENQLKTATGLSALWDGTPMTRTRSGDGSNTLYGRRCSLHLMLQPNIARELFCNSLLIGQGLLSRCLVTYPDSTIGTRTYIEGDLSTSVAGRAYFAIMTSLLEWPLPLAEGQRNELNPRELFLLPDAKREWISFHDHIETLMREGSDLSDIKGFAAKVAEHAVRLAGIMALVEDPCATAISHHTIQASIEISQFYISEALRLFHSANDDQELIVAEKTLEWAISYGGFFSLPCLYQYGPNKVRDKKKAKDIVDILLHHNRISPVGRDMEIGGKRRRDVWQVVS